MADVLGSRDDNGKVKGEDEGGVLDDTPQENRFLYTELTRNRIYVHIYSDNSFVSSPLSS